MNAVSPLFASTPNDFLFADGCAQSMPCCRNKTPQTIYVNFDLIYFAIQDHTNFSGRELASLATEGH